MQGAEGIIEWEDYGGKQIEQEDTITIIGNRAPNVKVEPYFWELSILPNVRQ